MKRNDLLAVMTLDCSMKGWAAGQQQPELRSPPRAGTIGFEGAPMGTADDQQCHGERVRNDSFLTDILPAVRSIARSRFRRPRSFDREEVLAEVRRPRCWNASN
jgi:hypothetical protein